MTSTLLLWQPGPSGPIAALISGSFYPAHMGVTTAVRPVTGELAVVQARGDRGTAEAMLRPEGARWAPDQQGLVWRNGAVTTHDGPRCLPASLVARGQGWSFAGNLLTARPDQSLRARVQGVRSDAPATPLSLATRALQVFASLPQTWFDARGLRSVGIIAFAPAEPERTIDVRVDYSHAPLDSLRELVDTIARYEQIRTTGLKPEDVSACMARGTPTDVDLVFSWLLSTPDTAALTWLREVNPELARIVAETHLSAGSSVTRAGERTETTPETWHRPD